MFLTLSFLRWLLLVLCPPTIVRANAAGLLTLAVRPVGFFVPPMGIPLLLLRSRLAVLPFPFLLPLSPRLVLLRVGMRWCLRSAVAVGL